MLELIESDCPVEDVFEVVESEVDEIFEMVEKDTGIVAGGAPLELV